VTDYAVMFVPVSCQDFVFCNVICRGLVYVQWVRGYCSFGGIVAKRHEKDMKRKVTVDNVGYHVLSIWFSRSQRLLFIWLSIIWVLSVPDEGYSRNRLCVLLYISTLFLAFQFFDFERHLMKVIQGTGCVYSRTHNLFLE
jgi:hypothetical protein